ncbi:Cyclic phosphodiesterase [Capsicum baccatum]|uniref:Cyclic phosphodiesterase n=1 Tax=Capsicum baccatum TaxID=33114 RepID=A0A2G2WW90_CAPBA|nr:Cyclic phosphodiesterase [Capsicum baccatum]
MFNNIFLIKFLTFLGLIGISLLFYSILKVPDPMKKVQLTEADTKTEEKVKLTEAENKTDVYSVWGLPSEEVSNRVKKLMNGLRSEFGGAQFEPHVTVVGAIKLSEEEARDKFRKGCGEVKKVYSGTVEKVDVGTFFYQCVYLLLHPTTEVVEPSARCCRSFGYNSSTPYMPHMSLLYADLTDEEKKKAQEKAYILDESIDNMSFQITRLALYKTDTEDKSLKSWEKIEEYNLRAN